MIVYIVWSEESLHEPMYIFIGNLVVNVMFGNSAVLPKMVTDLFFGLSTISLPGCLIQSFCYQSFGSLELFTFTAMAYDRYLAVCYPLRYPTLMTNGRALQIVFAIFVFVFLSIGVTVVLAARLSMCGVNINNVYCETMSLLRLACGDTTINDIFGTIWTMTVVIGCILVVIYCYIRTFLVCLKISAEAYQKAIHTLVTHIATFFTFMATSLFVIFRYRLGSGSLSTIAHVAISITVSAASVRLVKQLSKEVTSIFNSRRRKTKIINDKKSSIIKKSREIFPPSRQFPVLLEDSAFGTGGKKRDEEGRR
ncbi:olfactory receptor 10G3-like [Leptodactylus fuscus]